MIRAAVTKAERNCPSLRRLFAATPSMLLNSSSSSSSSSSRRQKHVYIFPREGKQFSERRERLRRADKVPEGAELIFLLPKERSVAYSAMDVGTFFVGCALFSSPCPPDYVNECLILKSLTLVAFLFFLQRRISSTFLRIYRVNPDKYLFVSPRFFFFPPRKKVREFGVDDVRIRDGVIFLGGKKMYCDGARFFRSFEDVEKMFSNSNCEFRDKS